MLSNRSSLIPPPRALWLVAAAVFAILVQVAPQAVAADTGTFGTVDVPRIGDMVVMPDGSILGSDLLNSRIYRVWPSGAVTVFAGAGYGGFDNGYSGDGGPAIDAHFVGIEGLAWAPDGSLLVVDHLNDVIRRIDANGIVTTVVGSGPLNTWSQGPWYPHLKGIGDGGPALSAILDAPWGITVDAAGNLYIADRDHDAVRRVDVQGVITSVAGTGQRGYGGDGGPATDARLNRPGYVAFSAQGGFYIADENNSRVRYVDSNGQISTFAGNGKLGCFGDGGLATAASLQNAGTLRVTPNGSLIVAQGECHEVRIVGPDGIIRSLAGNGMDGCTAVDGALATSISMDSPGGLAFDAHGQLLVSDPGCQVVFRIDSRGRVHIVADLHGLGQ
jgi:glucose/arabinose dehydrogenase